MLVSIKEIIFWFLHFLYSPIFLLLKSDDFFLVRFFDCSIHTIYLPEKGISFHSKAVSKLIYQRITNLLICKHISIKIKNF